MLHIADGKNLFKVGGANTIIDERIRVAGGQNTVQKAGNMLEINAEEIPNADPDAIIVGRTTPDILKRCTKILSTQAPKPSKIKKFT